MVYGTFVVPAQISSSPFRETRAQALQEGKVASYLLLKCPAILSSCGTPTIASNLIDEPSKLFTG
jgi:hypothetical protein